MKTTRLSVAKARMKSDDAFNDFRKTQYLCEEIKSSKLSVQTAKARQTYRIWSGLSNDQQFDNSKKIEA